MDHKSKLDFADQYLLNNKNDTLSTLTINQPSGTLYAEGTGMRGGGSGILITSKSKSNVVLLDVYRSENYAKFPSFFKIDESLRDKNNLTDNGDFVYYQLRERIKSKFKSLNEALDNIEEKLPFNKWTASVSEFPIIDDYIGDIFLLNGEKHVQIASRHLNHIVYNEHYYYLMDNLNRAALRLHEYIYTLSSKKNSIYTQILISYIMSEQFKTNSIIPDKIIELYLLLGFNRGPLTNPVFPEGFTITQELPKSDETCGQLKSISTNFDSLTIDIKVEFDSDFKNLTRKDIFDTLKTRRLLNFKNELILSANILNFKDPKNKHFMQFLIALNEAKNYLANQFPYYLYPAQSNPFDIICINHKKEISSFEISVGYNEVKNILELERANLEAQYFSFQRLYVLKLSKNEREIKENLSNIESMLLFYNDEISRYFIDPEKKLNGGTELGGLRVKFENEPYRSSVH